MVTITGLGIEVAADFSDAANPIYWRIRSKTGDDPWECTPFQVADSSHDYTRAFQVVNEWLSGEWVKNPAVKINHEED